MLKDVEHFNTKLNKIDGFGDLGNRLLELVNEKTTSEPAKPDTAEEAKPET